MGCMCHLLRTYERIGLKRGSSHVDWGVVGGRREKRLQRASVGASRRKIGPVPNLCILLSLSILSRVTAISASPLADFYRRSHRHLSCLSIEPLAAIPLGHPATAAINWMVAEPSGAWEKGEQWWRTMWQSPRMASPSGQVTHTPSKNMKN